MYINVHFDIILMNVSLFLSPTLSLSLPLSLSLSLCAGDLGVVDRTILSQTPSLSILFVSDGLTELSGFNATYTKFYKNTDIIGQ